MEKQAWRPANGIVLTDGVDGIIPTKCIMQLAFEPEVEQTCVRHEPQYFFGARYELREYLVRTGNTIRRWGGRARGAFRRRNARPINQQKLVNGYGDMCTR
eukprot:7925697-Pyramimonas_sp.AAC.1